MITAALLFVACGAAALVAGVATDAMLLVHTSIWTCVLAGALLATGVARSRPRRHAHGSIAAPTWSGAAQEPPSASSDSAPIAGDGDSERGSHGDGAGAS